MLKNITSFSSQQPNRSGKELQLPARAIKAIVAVGNWSLHTHDSAALSIRTSHFGDSSTLISFSTY